MFLHIFYELDKFAPANFPLLLLPHPQAMKTFIVSFENVPLLGIEIPES